MSKPVEDLEDPVVRHGRREAAFALTIFALALTYTVGYCSWFGYDRTAESLSFVLGFPAWVFWGVVAPWLVCTATAFWFSLVFMRDEPFEEAAHPTDAPAERSGPDGGPDGGRRDG